MISYFAISVRQRVPGEVTPASASQSGTPSDDEVNSGPGRAIDLHLGTYSQPEADQDGKSWLIVNLGGTNIHCVQKVLRYSSLSYSSHNWTCTGNNCSKCEGELCEDYTLTVSAEEAHYLSPISYCKYGDTVKLEKNEVGEFTVYELAIIVKEGNFYIQRKLILLLNLLHVLSRKCSQPLVQTVKGGPP